MPTKITKLGALFSILALLVASVPVGAMEWIGDQPINDSCCSNESACAPTADTDNGDSPLDEDCCPAGCDDCFLLCCNGLLSLNAFSVTLDVDQSSCGATFAEVEEFSPSHPRAIYHPPRG